MSVDCKIEELSSGVLKIPIDDSRNHCYARPEDILLIRSVVTGGSYFVIRGFPTQQFASHGICEELLKFMYAKQS